MVSFGVQLSYDRFMPRTMSRRIRPTDSAE